VLCSHKTVQRSKSSSIVIFGAVFTPRRPCRNRAEPSLVSKDRIEKDRNSSFHKISLKYSSKNLMLDFRWRSVDFALFSEISNKSLSSTKLTISTIDCPSSPTSSETYPSGSSISKLLWH
jgi:hypothetical protein